MGRIDYKRCKRCHRHAEEVGELTHQRFCVDCWPVVQEIHNRELEAHSGPAFANWRRAVARSVGAVLLDDLTPNA